jgi:hypothetical protein
MPITTRRWALVVCIAALVLAFRAETNQDVAAAQARKPIMMTRVYTGPDGLSHAQQIEMKLDGKTEKARVPTAWFGAPRGEGEFEIITRRIDVDSVKVLGACSR